MTTIEPNFGRGADAEVTGAAVKTAVSSNEPIYNMLIDTITHRVVETVDMRAEARSTRARAFFGAVFGVALTVGGAAAVYFIDFQVEQQFQSKLNAQFDRVELTTEMALLSAEADALNSTDRLDPGDADRAIQRARTLFEKFVSGQQKTRGEVLSASETLENRRLISSAVTPLFIAFGQAGRSDLMIALLEMVPVISLSNSTIVQAGTQTLGRSLLGSATYGQAVDDPSDKSIEAWYRRFAATARNARYPELHLLFEGPLAYVRGAGDAEIVGILEAVERLNAQDREIYISLTTDLLLQNWKSEADEETALVADRVSSFVGAWAERSPALQELLTSL